MPQKSPVKREDLIPPIQLKACPEDSSKITDEDRDTLFFLLRWITQRDEKQADEPVNMLKSQLKHFFSKEKAEEIYDKKMTYNLVKSQCSKEDLAKLWKTLQDATEAKLTDFEIKSLLSLPQRSEKYPRLVKLPKCPDDPSAIGENDKWIVFMYLMQISYENNPHHLFPLRHLASYFGGRKDQLSGMTWLQVIRKCSTEELVAMWKTLNNIEQGAEASQVLYRDASIERKTKY